MESNVFWDKISNLYYDYELSGKEYYVILDMNSGLEIILNISEVSIGGDYVIGLLEDGTEIIVSIDAISTLRHNPYWTLEDFIEYDEEL